MTDQNERDITRWAIIVLVVLVIVVGGLASFSITRSYKVEKAAKAATAASIQASRSADAAKQALDAAIAQGQAQSPSPAVTSALASIDRIERHLCGGKCPQ